MLPDRVSNPGPLTYESAALPIALRGPARCSIILERGKTFLFTVENKWYTVKILKFGTPQTIAIIVLKIEKFAVTLH